MEPAIQLPNSLPANYWDRYKDESAKNDPKKDLLFKSPVTCSQQAMSSWNNKTGGNILNRSLAIRAPLYQRPNAIIFNSPQDPTYGILSGHCPLILQIDLFVKKFKEKMFDGKVACSSVGLALCNAIVYTEKSVISQDVLTSIFNANKNLLEILVNNPDRTKWSVKPTTEYINHSHMDRWSVTLKELMTIVRQQLPLNIEEQEVCYKMFVEHVLRPKFKDNEEAKQTLLSCKGYIMDATVGDAYWGFKCGTHPLTKLLKIAEKEGHEPKVIGANRHGLALEAIRDEILDEQKQGLKQLTAPKVNAKEVQESAKPNPPKEDWADL